MDAAGWLLLKDELVALLLRQSWIFINHRWLQSVRLQLLF